MSEYLLRTRAWSSAAPGLPTIRGRRLDLAGRPTLHFLHGNGFCGGVYWQYLRLFLDGYGLFTHDMAGHGDSDPPPRFDGTPALGARIRQVIAEQGLDDGRPLIGIGHSRGAAMTVHLAARHPGLFKALVLLDPILLPAPVWVSWRLASVMGMNAMARGTRRRRVAWPSRDAALAHLRGRGIFQGWAEPALADFVDHAMGERDGQWALKCAPELEAQIYEQPVYPWRDLRRLRVPVLYLYGDRSYGFFPMSARSARRLNPRVEVGTAPGGHCFMLEAAALEQPGPAHGLTRQFLDRVAA